MLGAGGDEASNATGGWGNIFATSEDTWKCDSCMVRNDASDTICVACETPKPGHVAPVSKPSIATGMASIGAGGYDTRSVAMHLRLRHQHLSLAGGDGQDYPD